MAPTLIADYAMVGGVVLSLDLWLPPDPEGLYPGVIFIHGGGWSGGGPGQLCGHAGDLAKRGFVAASIRYRLSGEAPYPAALDDCQAAVRWLRRYGDQCHLDGRRLAVVGSSSGGHLAALLGTRDTRDETTADSYSSRVDTIVSVHGIYDFPTMGSYLRDHVTDFLGGHLEDIPEVWAEASPSAYVDGDAASMFIVHDPDDKTVPYGQSADFVALLEAAGRPADFVSTKGSGHGYFYNPAHPWTRKVWPQIVSWLQEQLGVKAHG